jgi:hypothetical protein
MKWKFINCTKCGVPNHLTLHCVCPSEHQPDKQHVFSILTDIHKQKSKKYGSKKLKSTCNG